MSNGVEVTETEAGSTFRVGDGSIIQLQIDHRVTLLLGGGTRIVLEAAFVLTRPDGTSERVPPGEVSHEVAAALPLFNGVVAQVHADRAGGLRVELVDGRVLVVEPDPQWESWQLAAPDGEEWVGLPGGGVSWYPPGVTTGTRWPAS